MKKSNSRKAREDQNKNTNDDDQQATIIRDQMIPARQQSVGADRGERKFGIGTWLRVVMIFTFMLIRNFAKEEHVGVTYDVLKTCVKDELLFTQKFGDNCQMLKRDVWLVSLEVSDSVLKRFGLPTTQSKRDLLKKQADLESQISIKDKCIIGVGYNMCIDVSFNAVQFFQKIEDRIEQLEKDLGRKLQAVNHNKIEKLEQFIETFAYYFEKGVNSEKTTDSLELFQDMMATVELIEHRDEIGGHSAQWIHRAQIEGCKVYAAAQNDDKIAQMLELPDRKGKLIWPREKIAQMASQKGEKLDDLHLVLEYNEGDTILGGRFTAPRSNRFYFVQDPNGSKLKQMDAYHSILNADPRLGMKVRRHMFGGHQLMQKLPLKEVEHLLKKEADLWAKMRQKQKKSAAPDTMIHIEFGDFSNEEFFALYDKYVIRKADSLGMNEQELQMVLDHWNNEKKLNEAKNSKPNFEDIIMQLKQFFEMSKQLELPVSRMHLHPYGSFLICYDPKKWEDAKEAIIKSSLAVPHYCVHPSEESDLVKEADYFEIAEMPERFKHPKNPGEYIEIQKGQLLYDFELNDDYKCYLQFSIKCHKLFKTAGLGDTVSGMGFIYHRPKNGTK